MSRRFVELREKLLDKLYDVDYFSETLDIEKIADAFGIFRDNVIECFKNGHNSRGILAYILCNHLNKDISEVDGEEIHWTVENDIGENLYLQCWIRSKLTSRVRALSYFSFYVRHDEGRDCYFFAKFRPSTKTVFFSFH